MANRYFLQLNGKSQWEEVDEFIYKNWKFAVSEKGDVGRGEGCRYSGNGVKCEDGRVDMFFSKESPLSVRDMAWVARMLGANKGDLDGYVQGPGIFVSPEYVMLKKGLQTILKRVGGEAFVAKEKKV